MKRLTEAQIRKVIREEIVGLLNEALEEKLAEFKGEKLINVLKSTEKNVQFVDFKNKLNDYLNKELNLSQRVMVSKSNCIISYEGMAGYFLKFTNPKEEGYKSFHLGVGQNGKVLAELIAKDVQTKIEEPTKKVTSDKSPIDTSGSVAGLPKNLRSLHGMTEQQLKSLIRRLIVNG